MALKLSKPMRDGGTAEYWRVAPTIHYEILTRTLVCHLMLYVNETARRTDKMPVPIPNLEAYENIPVAHLEGDDAIAAMAAGDPRGALYIHLKALNFFSGAEDV